MPAIRKSLRDGVSVAPGSAWTHKYLQVGTVRWHKVAKQTLDLMDAIGTGKFYIVGHDWGALISSVMVVDHPERFLGYVRMEAAVTKVANNHFPFPVLQLQADRDPSQPVASFSDPAKFPGTASGYGIF